MVRKSTSFLGFIRGRIAFYESLGNTSRAHRYGSALRRLEGYVGEGKDLPFSNLTVDFMEAFDAHLKDGGCCRNTVNFYNRVLKALYNNALSKGYKPDNKPFSTVSCANDKTVKRAIPLDKVITLAHLDLHGQKRLEYSRDMFMLSFYLRGMSWVDMATLKHSDVKYTHIVYHRNKTGTLLRIKIEEPIRKLLRKYIGKGEYLLNVVQSPQTARRDIYNTLLRINNGLHKLESIIGVDNLTMYVARHSWASAAKQSGVPVAVISEGMGHDSEMTTRIYLASLDTSSVDNANELLMEKIKFVNKKIGRQWPNEG